MLTKVKAKVLKLNLETVSYLTLGMHAQRGLRYLVCVCVCVCMSVTQHLTFHVFIRATNDTNLLRNSRVNFAYPGREEQNRTCMASMRESPGSD